MLDVPVVRGDDPRMSNGPAATVDCPSCGGVNLPGARFCSSCGTRLMPDTSSAETRKTVTVLFCDATSSTSLGEQLDPESLRGLMTRYFDVMRDAIEFHGGAVEKFIGDAVMAVFGVPTVHEDDAVRACRAAVEIRERLAAMDDQIRTEHGASIVWRMGINTGEVVAGDARAGQRLVTGDPVNIAARLEAAAAPGETLLGPETYALVRESVTSERMDPLVLKGKSEPVQAWRLVAVSGEMRRARRPLEAPLVGRRRPLRHLDEALREVIDERVCHLFTVLGTAGVGKSRLVDEFLASTSGAAQVVVGRCLPYGHGITYWPVMEAIRHGAGVTEDEPADSVLRNLRQHLQVEPDADRILAIIGALLGNDDIPSTPDEIFWAIRKTFEALARGHPLILVFDDVHWGEPTFLDLIEHMADWTRDAPILLIVMARPELLERRPAWGGGKRWVTTISLEPLSAVESEELVGGLLGQADLPQELRSQISAAAEGNPLFIEELLGKLIDDGFLVSASGRWSASTGIGQLVIPPTIQALLAARLDGLNPEERAVIERAAVEGKVFHRGAVTELAPEAIRQHVRDRLASLMRMELVRPDVAAFSNDEAYRFRHLLIRDAAYHALAKQTRSELHVRFADWLNRVAGDRLLEFQEIIGYHLEQAYRYRVELGPADDAAEQLAIRAGRLLADAGERARRRNDVAATADLLGRAAELLPAAEARAQRLAFHLGTALYESGQGERAQEILEQAVAGARDADDEAAEALARVALLQVKSSTASTELSDAFGEMRHLADVLDRNGDVPGARFARASAAFALFATGRAGEAAAMAGELAKLGPGHEAWQEEARAVAGAARVFGPAPVDQAIAFIESMSEDLGGPDALGPKLGIGRLRMLQGRFAEARALTAEARSGFEELGNRHRVASAVSEQAEIAYHAGDLDDAAHLARRAYEQMSATGDRSFASTFALTVARVSLDRGELDEAMRYARIALDTSSSDDVVSQAGGRSLEARVLSRRAEHEEAHALARDAEAIMSTTDYLVHHGEVAEDLAWVLHAAGREDEALAMAHSAADLFQAKGATMHAERTARLIGEWSH